jgi:hypothetical protein
MNECTIENINNAILKAKDKKDGFYTLKRMGYKVVSGEVTHVADSEYIYVLFGNFISKVKEMPKGCYDESRGQVMKQVFWEDL